MSLVANETSNMLHETDSCVFLGNFKYFSGVTMCLVKSRH